MLFALGLSVPPSYEPHPSKDAYYVLEPSVESMGQDMNPLTVRACMVSLYEELRDYYGRRNTAGLAMRNALIGRTKEQTLNDAKIYGALIAGKVFADDYISKGIGPTVRLSVKLCACPACTANALEPNKGENDVSDDYQLSLTDKHVANSAGARLHASNWTFRSHFSTLCAQGWWTKTSSRTGKLLDVKAPMSSQEAAKLLTHLQGANWLLNRNLFKWANDFPVEATVPMWDMVPNVMEALGKQIKGLYEWKILTVSPVWLRYASDGDKIQKHVLRRTFTPLAGWATKPILYDGLAWSIWLALEDKPIDERVFVTPDLQTYIVCDSCLRDALSSTGAGIDLYSPYSDAKMSLLQWCGGPGLSRRGGPNKKSNRVFKLQDNAISFEQLKAVYTVLEMSKHLKPLKKQVLVKAKLRKKPFKGVIVVLPADEQCYLYWFNNVHLVYRYPLMVSVVADTHSKSGKFSARLKEGRVVAINKIEGSFALDYTNAKIFPVKQTLPALEGNIPKSEEPG